MSEAVSSAYLENNPQLLIAARILVNTEIRFQRNILKLIFSKAATQKTKRSRSRGKKNNSASTAGGEQDVYWGNGAKCSFCNGLLHVSKQHEKRGEDLNKCAAWRCGHLYHEQCMEDAIAHATKEQEEEAALAGKTLQPYKFRYKCHECSHISEPMRLRIKINVILTFLTRAVFVL